MFLRSDFCKAKAADLMKRATTSPWPGTTLNLLKVIELYSDVVFNNGYNLNIF